MTKRKRKNVRAVDLRLAVIRASVPAGQKISRKKLAKALEVTTESLRKIEVRAWQKIRLSFWV